MRQVLSLSLPAPAVKQIKTAAKKRGYDSVSAYVNYLFQADSNLISEAELLKSVRAARREYRTRKSIKAKSMADLV